MAKLARESRLRERRLDKQAKRDARRLAPAPGPNSPGDGPSATTSEPERPAGPGPGGAEAGMHPLPNH
jgi:hypothetical protein